MKTPRIRLTTSGWLIAGFLLGVARPGPAQEAQILYSTPTSPARDNYSGAVGCQFQAGASNVVVSHLGFFDHNGAGGAGLAVDHNVGLFSSSLSSPSVLGQVVVPAGTSAYFTNGFRWMPLDPPLLLASNTAYLVAGVVSNADGDIWQDAFAPTWNTYFVGNTATTTRHALYGPGGTPIVWPPPSLSQNGNNNTYGNVSLAYIEVDQARVGVQTTNISISAGQTLTIVGFASGAPTITYQWYTNSLTTPLAGQTSAILTIPNATTNDSGVYFLTASNALGGELSANVTVLVTSFPVGITQQPTNLTVFANYPASFSIIATGSPPISYQWSRNGISISGANSSSYSLTAAQTNNGDVYSCLASNFTSLTPYTATSSNATLTVRANLALPQQFLHGHRSLATNNFGGLVGGHFIVGNSPVLVTHLGYFANGGTNLTMSHHVGIFSANGSVLYGYVIVPAGNYPDPTGTYVVTNGYEWAPLNPPLVLSNNTQYLLVAEVFSGSPTPDPWGDTYSIPDLNPYFASACDATYWGAAWPNAGAAGGYGGQMYSAPNLAILALSTPSAFLSPTNVTQYAGFNATFTATVAGQPPLVVQWFTNGVPLTGQTNLTLTLDNLTVGDSGNYYVVATNSLTGSNVLSAEATLTVLPDVGPSITNDIQSQSVFPYQNVQFTVGVSGTPPLSYQWTFNSNVITGATSDTLTLNNVSAANVGDYQVIVTNNYGSATSSVASLTITTVPTGSYPAAVMGPNLLAYYRFSDVNSGFGVATNQGVLGFAYNGTYEGSYSGVAGPTGFSNFEPDNQAVSLSGYDADVLVPPFGSLVVSNLTLAAWVMDAGGQPDNDAIFFQRSTYIFGLAIGQSGSGEWLKYTWNGGSYNNYTGLILPTNQWAFVAVVINPTNATVYLQDGTSMNSTNFSGTYPSATFSGNSYIGWDTAGGASGRRWAGAIDEVMIFNDALSPTAINALYAGVPAPVTLSIARSGNNLVLTWPRGTLLEATNLAGPWMTNNATSPFTNSPSGAMEFYRVQEQ